MQSINRSPERTKQLVEETLREIRYRHWTWRCWVEGDVVLLQPVWLAPDTETGFAELQRGRAWTIARRMTRSEIVRTAFLAVMTAEEHEIREQFRYRGQAVMTPHFDADQVAEDLARRKV